MIALQYIEIDIDKCGLTYGVLPCLAELGVTGTKKCFNSIATCQSRDTYSEVSETLRFAVPTESLPQNIECVPSIKSISYDPATVSIGKNLGERAALTIIFEDHKDADTGPGGDPYIADRSYNPYDQGTYFGKFRARHPFVRGRELRWINGYVGQALHEMEVRYFIVESFSGPAPNGEYKLVAKDILKLADGDRAQAPVASTGYLSADINDVVTTLSLLPSGVGAEYAVYGWGAIGGKEIVAYARSGDTFTISRAQLGTAASTHKAQDRFQEVLNYQGVSPEAIIADLLINYAGIPGAYIPFSIWEAEAEYINRLYSAVIPQPTSVATLVSELIEQAGFSIWPDDRNRLIQLQAIRPVLADAAVLDADNSIIDSMQISEQPDLRLSQVHTYFAQINPLTSISDKSNFRSISVVTDEQAEEDYGSAVIKEIFSRWIPELGRATADRIGSVLLARFRDPPRHFALNIMRNSMDEIILGRGYYVGNWSMQDDEGLPENAPAMITKLKNAPDVLQIEADELLFSQDVPGTVDDPDVFNLIIDADTTSINLRSAYNTLYPEPVSGQKVVIRLNTDVTVSAYGYAVSSINVGTWPAGVDVILVIEGDIFGAGGLGGNGWGVYTGAATAGTIGGAALYTTNAIKIELRSTGKIWGGGGGGGGGGTDDPLGGGGGGGGGGGLAQGAPGVGGLSSLNGVDGSPSDPSGIGGGAGGDGALHAYGSFIDGGGGGYNGAPGSAGDNGSYAAGAAGGAAGPAINGIANVTFGTWDASTSTFTTTGTYAGSIAGPMV